MSPECFKTYRRYGSLFLLWSFFSFLILSNGCAWLIAAPENDAAAQRQVARWVNHNSELKQFKGLYRIRMDDRQRILNMRAALAAAMPDQLRVELLNLLGQPLLRLAANGEQIAVLIVADQKFHRFKQSSTALKPFLHVPIGTGDLLDTLSGRPALPGYAAVQAEAVQDGDGATMLLFKDRWHNRVADLLLDAAGRIQRLRRFNADETVQFETQWTGWRDFNGYLVPDALKLMSGSGEQVALSVERLWTEVDLPPSLFTLPQP